MKLKNKKTGEIVDVESLGHANSLKGKFGYQVTLSWKIDEHLDACKTYNSLAELNEEWEDYEEPETFWYMTAWGDVKEYSQDQFAIKQKIAIGNYFETKEEAEKAVEKLKAVAKLKEFGFRFIDWELDMKTVADGKIWFDIGINTEWDAERLLELKPEAKESLDILFSQEGEE